MADPYASAQSAKRLKVDDRHTRGSMTEQPIWNVNKFIFRGIVKIGIVNLKLMIIYIDINNTTRTTVIKAYDYI